MMAAAFLTNFLFWSGLSIGGVVLAALVDVTGGEWLGTMRDTAERFSRFLPVSFVLFVVLMWRRSDFYPWARQPTGTWWLTPAAVAVRDALALGAVYTCAFAYCRASRRSRGTADRPSADTRTAVAFLIVYAIGFSIIAVDLIMSLEPRWTSTLFPAYVFTGNVYAGTAAIATLASWQHNADQDAPSTARMRDAANLLIGLALFWMYLFWSQFLVIWYGNLSGEVGFVMARINTSRAPGWLILASCWAAPAVAFVPQWGKRAEVVRVIGLLILIGCWLERWLLVAPDLPPTSAAPPVVMTLAFAGVFVLSMKWPVVRVRRAARP